MSATPPEFVARITQLRDNLGFTCQQIARTGEPVVVQRYSRQEVIMVPLSEWRWLKGIEQAIREGRLPWPPEEPDAPDADAPPDLETEPEISLTWLDDPPELR